MPDQTPLETAHGAAAAALGELVDGSAGTMVPTGHYPEELAEIALKAAAPVLLAEVEAAEQRGYQARVEAERELLRSGHSSYDDGYRDALEHNRGVHAAHRAEAVRVLEADAVQRGQEQAARAIVRADPPPEVFKLLMDGPAAFSQGFYEGKIAAYHAARGATPTPAGGEAERPTGLVRFATDKPLSDEEFEAFAQALKECRGPSVWLQPEPEVVWEYAYPDVDHPSGVTRLSGPPRGFSSKLLRRPLHVAGPWEPAPAPPAEEPAPAEGGSGELTYDGANGFGWWCHRRHADGQDAGQGGFDTAEEAAAGYAVHRAEQCPVPAPTSGEGEQ